MWWGVVCFFADESKSYMFGMTWINDVHCWVNYAFKVKSSMRTLDEPKCNLATPMNWATIGIRRITKTFKCDCFILNMVIISKMDTQHYIAYGIYHLNPTMSCQQTDKSAFINYVNYCAFSPNSGGTFYTQIPYFYIFFCYLKTVPLS